MSECDESDQSQGRVNQAFRRPILLRCFREGRDPSENGERRKERISTGRLNTYRLR